MPDHPLAEVFGFPVDNFSRAASRHRRDKLCPFNNKVAHCTKDKANDPLGVCSIFDGDKLAITCPVRFRQEWIIVEDAAAFFFPDSGGEWTYLPEVRLRDRQGKAAGNIDIVLVAYDSSGRLTDFGALEVQSVYITGNIRRPFEFYMGNPRQRAGMDWTGELRYPKPDYLSSSRKRLIPQILAKGQILRVWGKKIGVALDKSLFDTLPTLPEVVPAQADIAWFVYDLALNAVENTYSLVLHRTVYTTFAALEQITQPAAGNLDDFLESLQAKLDDKLDSGIGRPPSRRDALL